MVWRMLSLLLRALPKSALMGGDKSPGCSNKSRVKGKWNW